MPCQLPYMRAATVMLLVQVLMAAVTQSNLSRVSPEVDHACINPGHVKSYTVLLGESEGLYSAWFCSLNMAQLASCLHLLYTGLAEMSHGCLVTLILPA